jgi:hypothetical protein
LLKEKQNKKQRLLENRTWPYHALDDGLIMHAVSEKWITIDPSLTRTPKFALRKNPSYAMISNPA